MARKVSAPAIATRSARLRLPVQGKPHGYTNIAPGVSLGYRRNKKGAGTWVVKVADGKQSAWTARVGVADDYEDSNGSGHVLTYWEAIEKARLLARGSSDGRPATVATALDDYEADLRARNGDPINASRVRRHLPGTMLNKPVGLTTVAEWKRVRNGMLAAGVAPATVVRVCKSLRAALNMAADHDAARISNRVWKVGLGGIADTYIPVNKVLSDADVLRLVEAAAALDPAFGLIVETLATTGTRTSQATRLTVADLQAERGNPRLLMPSSRKGKHRKSEPKPVPITPALAAKLKRAAAGRPPDAPLLVRSDGAAWEPTSSELGELFARIAKECGLDCTAYALRHSSITRALLRGVPTRLVASLHDTSSIILERVYSRFIADHGDAIARKGLLGDAEPSADNVITLPGRR
jgi:integrase